VPKVFYNCSVRKIYLQNKTLYENLKLVKRTCVTKDRTLLVLKRMNGHLVNKIDTFTTSKIREGCMSQPVALHLIRQLKTDNRLAHYVPFNRNSK
jgi:hypothetical protein